MIARAFEEIDTMLTKDASSTLLGGIEAELLPATAQKITAENGPGTIHKGEYHVTVPQDALTCYENTNYYAAGYDPAPVTIADANGTPKDQNLLYSHSSAQHIGADHTTNEAFIKKATNNEFDVMVQYLERNWHDWRYDLLGAPEPTLMAAVQMASTENLVENIAAVMGILTIAHKMGVKFITFPEQVLRFHPDYNSIKTDFPYALENQVAFAVFSAAAREFGMWIVGGTMPDFPEEELEKARLDPNYTPKFHNTSAIFSPYGPLLDENGQAIAYDKVYPHPDELGEDGKGNVVRTPRVVRGKEYPVIMTPFGKIAPSVCRDIREPEHFDYTGMDAATLADYLERLYNSAAQPVQKEALARTITMLRDPQIADLWDSFGTIGPHPFAWRYETQRDHEGLMHDRAYGNQVILGASQANARPQVGRIVEATGETLLKAGKTRYELLIAPIDHRSALPEIMREVRPENMRTPPQHLVELYNALHLALAPEQQNGYAR